MNDCSVDAPSHLKALLLAVGVTVLWSSSWVLIKLGLQGVLPPLTFAGLRYTLAFLILLPLLLAHPVQRTALRQLNAGQWRQLAALGLVFYTLTQGAQFVGLAHLPAAALTLLLNCTPIVVALASPLFGHEPPVRLQWLGIAASAGGTALFLLPFDGLEITRFGLFVGVFGVMANAGSALLGRHVNRHSGLPVLLVTTVSMGLGGVMLLVAGLATQGLGTLDGQQWLIVGWLAAINTALAFSLWNLSLRALSALESSLINGLMLPQIAVFAWVFLDEPLSLKQIAGLALVACGGLLVQLHAHLPAWASRRKA